MELLKLLVVFAAIILVLRIKNKLWLAFLCGCVLTVAVYGMDLPLAASTCLKTLTHPDTLILVACLYFITFLQRMMEKRKHLDLAQSALSGLFNNRRVNASAAPVFIGFLPSPGAIYIASAMVDKACGDDLPVVDRAFTASYFRHVSESFMPTYTYILMACQLSGVGASAFVLGMLPMVFAIIALGYFFELRKLPKETGLPPSKDRRQDARNLLKSLWSILATIVLVLVFQVPVYLAVPIIIVAYYFINHFSPREISPYFRSAWEWEMIINTVILLLFKDLLMITGVVDGLPDLFGKLPLPAFLIFFLIFFVCTLAAGSTGTVTLGIPLAFAAIPNGGMPLLVLLISCIYAATQVSPAHICLFLCCDHYHISLGALIKKSLPVVLTFYAILIPYYLLLRMVF